MKRSSLTMELSVPFRFRSRNLLSPSTHIPITYPSKHQPPFLTKFVNKPKISKLTVRAQRRAPIEGLSDELNAIARCNLDFAYTRRRVRAAFADMQQQLDHCLFKVRSVFIMVTGMFQFVQVLMFMFCF